MERKHQARWWAVAVLALCSSLAACEGPEATGIGKTPPGTGPRVIFDLSAKPLPEIPLPNNVATRLDESSPTGRRLNVTIEATTQAEQKLRRKINELDGFGVFQPITASFDSRLDLEDLKERHVTNHSFADDAMLLVNVDPVSPGFKEVIPLDFGQGNYPLGLEWSDQYWDMDEHADSPNMLFETHDEDLNGNGKLDPYEDIDFDGVLDKPNTWSGNPITPIKAQEVAAVLGKKDRPIDDLVSFYEMETETIVVWPVVPLREKTTYAVVLTRHMKGATGEPVRSPFGSVNHLSQNDDLSHLEEVLGAPEIAMSGEDIAFTWSFTTQSVTADFEAIRAGIYGHGPLAELAAAYPPDMEPKVVVPENEDATLPEKAYVLYTSGLDMLFGLSELLLGYDPAVVKSLQLDAKYTDYFVLGSFTTPYFLADQDGIATPMYPADDNESFDVNPETGEAVHGPSTASFMCSIPKATATSQPPFPVVTYGHGYSGAPFEALGFAGRFAQFGFAFCALDAVGHGLALPSDEDINYEEMVPTLLGPMGLLPFYRALQGGRIRDLDNDGKATSFDNGGDFWSYDIFHTRDCVRQAAIDHLQFVRVLRSLGESKWSADTNGNGKADDLMGDFDGDGVVDLGTSAHVDYPVWGQSMGAIVSMLLAGIEPTASTATPISGAGGLIHVGIRSTNPGVPEAVWMPLMGPFVVFTPLGDEDDTVELAIMINDQHRENRPEQIPRPHYYPFARTNKISPGDRVIVRNLSNGETVEAFRHKDGSGFRVSIPADALSAVEKRPLLGLQDGDTQPVPVSCEPGSLVVTLDEDGSPVGPASCAVPDLQRSLLFGDALEVEVLDGWDGDSKGRFNTFGLEVEYQGAIFPVESPLVALNTGLGHSRNTPDLRKLMGFSSMILARGDPISYARHYARDNRLDFSYDPGVPDQSNVIIYHTIGDPNTPISTSLNQARAAGILEYLPASGTELTTENDRLLGAFVAEAVEGFWRHTSAFLTLTDWEQNSGVQVMDLRWPDEFIELLAIDPDHPLPVHADPDNLDAGTDEYGEPTVGEPVRATSAWDEKSGTMVPFAIPSQGFIDNPGGFMALRLPFYAPLGAHGIEPSNPAREFNINSFVENQICIFMKSNGTRFSDAPCLAHDLCDFLPASVRAIGQQLAKEK